MFGITESKRRRELVRVLAEIASIHEAFADVPDERSSSLLVFEDDVQMTSTSSQNADGDSHLKITETDGRIELCPAFAGECSLHLSRGGLSVTVEHDSFGIGREMEAEFDYFADRLLGDGALYPDGRHGLQDVRIIDALHESAERREPVDL